MEWFYQKEGAERAVRRLTGVKGVLNAITLAPQTTPRDVKKRIKDALHRAVELDADRLARGGPGPRQQDEHRQGGTERGSMRHRGRPHARG